MSRSSHFVLVISCCLSSLAISSAGGQTADELIKRLQDPDAGVRRLAAERLGKQKAEAAIPAIAELLKDRDRAVRNAAAEALVEIGPKSVPALAKALSYPDEPSRLAALDALGDLAPDARMTITKETLAALKTALMDKAIDVRIHAAFVLGEIGGPAKSCLPALYEAAKDTSNLGDGARLGLPMNVTVAAIDACVLIDPKCGEQLAKAAVPELVKALRSKDQTVVKTAASGLARLGPHARSAIQVLKETRKSAHRFVQSSIDDALAAIDTDGAIKVLGETINDPKAPLRLRLMALSDLWKFRADEKVMKVLAAALKDPSPEIRAGAVDAIRGPEAKLLVPTLLGLLGDQELQKAGPRRLPDPVPEALARIGADAVPGLVGVLKNKSNQPAVRLQAAKALAKMGRKAKAAMPALKAASKDDVLAVAVESACGYVRAGGDIADAMPAVRRGLQDKSPLVIWISTRAVSRLGSQARPAIPDLLPLLKHEESEVRIGAMHALSVMGPAARKAVPAMAERLKSGDARECFQAASALQQMGPAAKDALPVLIEQLPRLEKIYPHPVIVTLGNLGPDGMPAIPALLKLLVSEDGRDGEILDALGQMGPAAKAAVPQLMAQLENKSKYPRAKAARALGRVGPEAKAAVPALNKRLADEDKAVRVWAAFALARITGDHKPNIALLIEAWKANRKKGFGIGNDIRYDVAQAFELLGAKASPARDILLEGLDDKNIGLGTHLHIVRALGQLEGDAEVIVPRLIAFADQKSPAYDRASNCEHAAIALGMLGPKAKAAIPLLRKLKEDDDNTVSDAATQALEKIDRK